MYLDKAVEKLTEAYSIDPGNPDSSYKISVAYFLGNDCVRASEYLNMAEELGSPNITEAYKIELEEKCSDGNLDCSGLKTGRFRNTDERYGVTIIERTEKFQIEEDPETGHNLKLEITWIDDCTYVEVLEGPEKRNLPTMILTCVITEITDGGYIQISSSDEFPLKLNKEVIRID